MLASRGVGRVIDVRRYPGSRRHPHLERTSLQAGLRERGIAYEWWGDALGGRRKGRGKKSRHRAWRNDSFRAYADHMESAEFRNALVELERRALEQPPAAIMCAETLWWRCHRRLIADALVEHGCSVVHLLDSRSHQAHVLHPAARSDESGGLVYDEGTQGTLIE